LFWYTNCSFELVAVPPTNAGEWLFDLGIQRDKWVANGLPGIAYVADFSFH
jgi:hypothetical protein